MSSRFGPLEIPPGVMATATKKMRSSAWSEVNAVRWIEGQLQPIGGQAKITYSMTFASRCRAIHQWYDLTGKFYTAYLCETNVYVDIQGTLSEITPTGGLPAPGTATGGYGMGTYNGGNYGVPPRTGETPGASLSIMPAVYSIDNFGALLLVMTSPDGRLLSWDPASPATLLTQVADPTNTAPPGYGANAGKTPLGRGFVVTSARFVWMYGMYGDSAGGGSARRFGWCDQGDITDWNFASTTNQAGYLDVEPGSPIVTAHAGRANWVVFFTEKKAYVSRYIALPYVYDYEELADDCTPWSPASISTTSSLILWMSQQGMFSFDGTSVLPVRCAVRPWITNHVDQIAVRWQAHAAHIGSFNEFWWFFPEDQSSTLTANAGNGYNSLAVFYNYKEGWWSQALMPRSAGVTSNYGAYPVFADGTVPYQHEQGTAYANCPLPYADTFDLNLNSGGRLTTVKQLIPDIDGNAAGLRYQLYYRNSRSQGAPELVTTPIAPRPDGYVDMRTTGRDIRMRISVVGPLVTPWTVGQHLIDVVPRGDR